MKLIKELLQLTEDSNTVTVKINWVDDAATTK